MRAVVTIAIGDDYQRRFVRYCRDNWAAYARRHGYELVVFDQPLDRSERGCSRPVAWQKCLVLQQAAVMRFRQVAWVDCDIVINAEAAPPIFEGVSEEKVGAVDQFRAPDAATHRKVIAAIHLRLRAKGTPFFNCLTPEQFYRDRGLPEHPAVVQTGVLVCSPEHHGPVFRDVYECYENNDTPGFLYELPAMSHELIRKDLVQWIDQRFNRSVLLGIEEFRLRHPVMTSDPREAAERGAVRPIIAGLLSDCHFLHFAGCQGLMDYLPTP